MTTTAKVPNDLIHSGSPYLRQHAYNPVNWVEWSAQAFEDAKAAEKLVIVSIGYSACHWCHVMEHESFEDDEIATVMNKFFVCIKVDREERPDIDQIYMDAVQLMTGRGGWPLNCITLPDQRPIYGGTYFPKEQWRQVLLQVYNFYKSDPVKCAEYAEELTQGVKRVELIKPKQKTETSPPDFADMYLRWSRQFDNEEGGPNRAPKFALPDSYQFLLHYYFQFKDESCKEHVDLTLKKLAYGGIYDQIGGGFTRYSTDLLWKVPHFEKMLYDNGQMLSLFANAYRAENNILYKEICYQIIEFVERELTSPSGGFYAALDADSEGEEGKFYVWKKEEVEELFKEEAPLFLDYFNINEKGYWEHGNYIPLRDEDDEVTAERYKISVDELRQRIIVMRLTAMNIRSKRVAPGLDNKVILGWNALMIKGLADAYCAFKEIRFIDLAERNLEFIQQHLTGTDGLLHHNCKDPNDLPQMKDKGYAFLDDYALMIDAYIHLYQAIFKEEYLIKALELTKVVIENFSDDETGFFWYTPNFGEQLIARKMEVQDNVIPSANGIMAKNLFRLARYFALPEYEQRARSMVMQMSKEIHSATPWYSGWAQVLLNISQPFYEVAITGDDSNEIVDQLHKNYQPNMLVAAAKSNSEIPLLNDRFTEGKLQVFVCRDNTCSLPVNSFKDLTQLLNQ